MKTSRSAAALLAAIAFGGALAGCSSRPNAARLSGACPVTLPGGELPGGAKGFDYGNVSLAVKLWPGGVLRAGRLADGSSFADVEADGSIVAKLGWWRGVDGRLTISGERLDAPAPPLRSDVPAGYGRAGFQPTGVTFPTEGCWRVTGSVARARLSFVVRVRRR